MLENTFEELKMSGDLPSPSGIGMRILQLTQSEDYDTEEIGATIMTDSSLTGRILKLANTAGTGGLEPATTVGDAIMRLGTGSVRDLSLAFSLISDRSVNKCDAFDYETYWSKSLARAVCAQGLSRLSGVGKPEQAYICGLLAEIGRLALASVYPDVYSEILAEELDFDELLVRETEKFNINHSEVAALMLRDWGLPENFAESVELFTQKRQVGDEHTNIDDLSAVLRFGDLLGDACVVSEETSTDEWIRLGSGIERVCEIYGHDERAFASFFDSCVAEWVEWGKSLDISTGRGVRGSELARQIEESLAGVDDEQPDSGGAAVPTVKPQVGSPAATDRDRVLVVDSNEEVLASLVHDMSNQGYEVLAARDGNSALHIALDTSPDIVIASWEMADLSGLDLCRSLRSTGLGRRMFFLVMTDNAEEEAAVEAFDAGVDDLIVKPYSPRILKARVKGGLRLAALQRKVERDKQTMMRQVAELGMLTRKLRTAALTDALTELPNRRYGMKRLESEWASTERTGRPLTLVMMDIDHFKAVNDNHGHDVGDAVLRDVAKVLRDSTRQSDEVCRIGGEEFIIICKNTDEHDGRIVAERVRSAVESHVVAEPGFDSSVTLSLGVAAFSSGVNSITGLFKAADEAVYAAKTQGRNRVCLWSEVTANKRRSA